MDVDITPLCLEHSACSLGYERAAVNVRHTSSIFWNISSSRLSSSTCISAAVACWMASIHLSRFASESAVSLYVFTPCAHEWPHEM